MSRDGSGGYSLPNDPLITGETSDVSDYNGTMDDIATEIANSVAKDGQSTMTGNLKMGSNKVTGLAASSTDGDAVRYEEMFQNVGADIASASALAVNIEGSFHNVTGTTTITSLAATTHRARKVKVLQFNDALTLTHHATDLILPGGANITTAAGDIGFFYEYASGDWRCVSYVRAADAPLDIGTNVQPYDAQTARIATGTYTGDGTESQGITGVGFQPTYVKIWVRATSDNTEIDMFETTDTIVDDNAAGGAYRHRGAAGTSTFETNAIISLDSDGFTVDDNGADNDPNANGTVYNYMAMG